MTKPLVAPNVGFVEVVFVTFCVSPTCQVVLAETGASGVGDTAVKLDGALSE